MEKAGTEGTGRPAHGRRVTEASLRLVKGSYVGKLKKTKNTKKKKKNKKY